MMLVVEGLTCAYGKNIVLRDISFEVARGEFVGIIGPNGSGKTTLVKAITKVLKPIRGRISVDGTDVSLLSFKELARRVAVVSQSPDIEFDMTVEEFILLGRIPHRRKFQFLESREDERAALKAMDLTGLLHLKDRILKELSGGERQLALIARALAQEPDLLILDEPTAHLDITHQVSILNLLKRLNGRENLTVITVLHDLNLAAGYCDRLIMLKEGKVYKVGKPEEVLTSQIIGDVYQTEVIVGRDPISFKPHIFPISEEGK